MRRSAAPSLIGALAVGDSVRQSLRAQALDRLGQTSDAVHMFDRFFRQDLTAELSGASNKKNADQPAEVVPILQIAATSSNRKNKLRAANVQLHGVTEDFWSFTPPDSDQLDNLPDAIPMTGVIINDRLAQHLQIAIGDEVLFRIAKPSVLPRDAPLSVADDLSTSINLKVVDIVNDQQMGNFNLRPDPIVPFNAFMDLTTLQDEAQLLGKVNMALSRRNTESASQTLASGLDKHWQLADVELELRPLVDQRVIELRSGRIFIDGNIVEAATKAAKTLTPKGQPPVQLLTYFVNGITNKKNRR